MSYLNLTCLITAIPALYPLFRMVKKKELNMFDLLILFSTLHFSVSPIKEGEYANFTDFGVTNVFVFYFLFIYLLLVSDVIYHRNNDKTNCIINITKYLQNFYEIRFGLIGKLLIGLCLLVMLVYYLPRATIVAASKDLGVVSYEESSLTMAFGYMMKVAGFLLFLDFSYSIKNKKYSRINICYLLAYTAILLFFPRREFLSGLLQLLIAIYSVHRRFFSMKRILMFGALAAFLWGVYFPFYNVIRWNPVNFDSNHPVESLVSIVEYGIENYAANSADQLESSEQRSLGLYQAVYMLASRNITPQYGKVTLASIDVAIPKVLNPNKGSGSEGLLEQMTGAYVDIADSFMLLSYGEFGLLGGIYCCVLYLFFILLYSKYAKFYISVLSSRLVPIFVMFTLLDSLWNVEGKVESYISWFFGSAFTVILILIVEKKKAITVR